MGVLKSLQLGRVYSIRNSTYAPNTEHFMLLRILDLDQYEVLYRDCTLSWRSVVWTNEAFHQGTIVEVEDE